MTPQALLAIIRAAEKAKATADKNCGWEQSVIDADRFIAALKEELETVFPSPTSPIHKI